MSRVINDQNRSASQFDPRRVLLVENSPDRTLPGTLADAGFAVTTLGQGENALEAIDRSQPHLVMLDLEYPGIVAISLIRRIQGDAPVLRPRLMALSQHSGEQQIVSSFELGLDDYVIKPYSVPVVVARVKAILRAKQHKAGDSDHAFMQFQRLRMDIKDHRLMIDDRFVSLRPMEFRLLAFLMSHPERVFTRGQILSNVWDRGSDTDERAVDVNIQRTRKVLARFGCGDYLQTVRAFGYRLSAMGP